VTPGLADVAVYWDATCPPDALDPILHESTGGTRTIDASGNIVNEPLSYPSTEGQITGAFAGSIADQHASGTFAFTVAAADGACTTETVPWSATKVA
jgi:hypothetical protein